MKAAVFQILVLVLVLVLEPSAIAVRLTCTQQVGQRVRCDVEGIGTLEHTIVAGEQVVDYVKNGMDGLLQPPAPAPAGVRT